MSFIKEVYQHFIRSNTWEKGAALSYYAAFSILPILMIIISIIGAVFPEDIISEELSKQLISILGEQGASQLEDIITNQHLYHDNIFTTLIGIGTFILAATGMFNQIQRSLNSIWGLKVKAKKTIRNYFVRRLTSFGILIIIGFILLLSTGLNSLLFKFSATLPDAYMHANIYELIFSFFIIILVFTIFFMLLGNAIVPFKTAAVSAIFTTVLFVIGKIAIGMYIAHSSIKSSFGTASVIAILMFWVYYTSQILYLGASFAYVFGKKTGREITPSNMAVRFVQQEIE